MKDYPRAGYKKYVKFIAESQLEVNDEIVNKSAVGQLMPEWTKVKARFSFDCKSYWLPAHFREDMRQGKDGPPPARKLLLKSLRSNG